MSSSAKQSRELLLFYAYQDYFQKQSLKDFDLFFNHFAKKSFSKDFLTSFIALYDLKKETLNQILAKENLDKFNLIDALLIKLMLCERLYLFTKSQNLLHYINLSKEYSTKEAYKVIHVLMDRFLKIT